YGVHYFKVKGDANSHKLRIQKILATGVWFMFNSDQVEVFLTLGETKSVDINGDGVADVILTLESFTSNGADVSIMQAGDEVVEETPAEPEVVAEPEPEVIAEEAVILADEGQELPKKPKPEAEKKSTLGIVLLVIAAVLLIMMIALSIMKGKKNPKQNNKK
ncbi:MAG: hypothetical protein KKF46_04040, partial [Nanoarchaeota archaeon]|nr:hypothetical protein [Nanoarchaeota archaeon]MBU1321505.1 hypothetical protein [Nanoarchaeota archaeon]MBU1597122.1 hypothetical protein [Nanoarchaeota archaeon]